MPKRSKFFCVAVEGATCDGRTLDKGALEEMAATYDPATYTARINMEHIRGFSAEPPFNAYGDVIALETREVELQLGGKAEKKLGLFAQVDALDTLVELKNKGQKLFSSIEINPNFAGTGKAYLQGLAVTDSPASLGTAIMEFAAAQVKEGKDSIFAERKIEKSNFFSASQAVDGFEFTDPAPENESSKLFAAATAFFAQFTGKAKDDAQAAAHQTPSASPASGKVDGQEQPANDNDFAAIVGQGFSQLTAAIAQQGTEFNARLDKLEADQGTLKASVESTEKPGTPNRPAATGAQQQDRYTFC